MTLYRVDFLDHSENYGEAIRCSVYGHVVSQDDVSITLETWSMTDPRQEEDLNDTSTFTIIRAAITRLVQLDEQRAVSRDADLLTPGGREQRDSNDREGTLLESEEYPLDGDAG